MVSALGVVLAGNFEATMRFILRRVAFVAAISVATCGIASAQVTGVPTKSVTNADVVSMVTVRLSDDVILGAVQQAATTDFDLSPEALIALKNDGVSDRVLQAMQTSKTAQLNAAQANSTGTLGVAAVGSPSSEPCRIFITEEDPASRSYVVVRKEVQAG